MGIWNGDSFNKSWTDVVKTMLMKPYVYIFGSILIFSPYGVDIVNAILKFLSR